MGCANARAAVFVSFIGILLAACDAPGSTEAPGNAGANAGAAAASGAAEPRAEAPADELADDVAKASYSLGFSMAENLLRNYADSIEEPAFLRGVQDRFAGAERAVSPEDARAALSALAARQKEALAGRAAENLAVGKAFLAENGAREGVTTLPSGLQYEVLTPAEGAMPGPTDRVTTNYHGTLVDGTVFDSSYDRGEPASFPLNGVIPGWTEALQLMAVGAKWRLYIPPELAYGAQDRGPIPANSTLIFDVELLEIQGAN